MTLSLSDPWTMLGLGALALLVWGGVILVVWTLLYAHGERERDAESTYVPVGVED